MKIVTPPPCDYAAQWQSLKPAELPRPPRPPGAITRRELSAIWGLGKTATIERVAKLKEEGKIQLVMGWTETSRSPVLLYAMTSAALALLSTHENKNETRQGQKHRLYR
jgi:hypothetical protein